MNRKITDICFFVNHEIWNCVDKKAQGVNLSIFEKLHTLQALKTNVKRHKIFESTTLRRQTLAKYENITKYSNPNFKKYYLTFLGDV